MRSAGQLHSAGKATTLGASSASQHAIEPGMSPQLAWRVPRRATQREARGLHSVRCAALTTNVPTIKAAVKPRQVQIRQEAEEAVLSLLRGVKGRGKDGLSEVNLRALEEAVAVLEADGGVPAPTASPLLEGRWRLLFTTRPGTASPIQRTFTGVDAFTVYQEIKLMGPGPARVNNIVDFGAKVGVLKVEAEAITDRRPMEGFVPRRGAGLALFGKSMAYPPASKDLRVDFAFDFAAFTFRALPFKIPYPVPFKLLGDETKGWIDVTYLSPDGQLRVSRGNKGTTFILVKDEPPRQRLLDALSAGAGDDVVEPLVEALAAEPGEEAIVAPARSPAAEGVWRLRWSQQAANANPLQSALSGRVASFQVVGDSAGEGRLDNVVRFAPGLELRAGAACGPVSDERTSVILDEAELKVGPFSIALPGIANQATGDGYIDWLYLDPQLRVTRGNKGSVFVHTRE